MNALKNRLWTYFALLLLIASSASAQTKEGIKITVSFRDAALADALREIEKQSGLYFSYDPALVSQARKVNYKTEEALLQDVLKTILSPFGLSFKIIGEQVIIQKADVIKRFNLSGSIKDASNGETLAGAVVVIDELPGTGVSANSYGYYALPLFEGVYTVSVSFVGYQTIKRRLDLSSDVVWNIDLQPSSTVLQEVVVSKEKMNRHVTNSTTAADVLTIAEIKNIPMIFGESDVLKTIQLLPGVKGAGEGGSGFYVRGGNADENLILLDEAVVYNPSHVFGFFSVFNSDALKEVTLYKGGIPAEYGGRLSSVLDVKMKDGNMKDYEINGGLGLIASRLSVEGPIVKDKGSFMVSGRRTYADMFLKMSSNPDTRKTKLFFYDLNTKANYILGKKDRLFVSGYFGRDVFDFRNEGGINWGNATGTVRWNHIYNNRVFSNTTFVVSDFDFRFYVKDQSRKYSLITGIREYSLKKDISFFHSSNHDIKMGFASSYLQFVPGKFKGDFGIIIPDSLTNYEKRHAWENAIYARHDARLTEKITINYGLRLVSFSLVGPGTYRTFDGEGKITSEEKTAKGEFVKTYFNAEPRVIIGYAFTELHALKAAYNRTTQNIHLLSNSTASLPMDVWIPSSKQVKQSLCDHVSLGYYASLFESKYEFTLEGYYKHMLNQIDYKNNAQIFLQGITEDQLAFGTGRAYGAEVLLRRKVGKFTGWVSYTLARTERRFDVINRGDWFPAKQDRTHDLTLVFNMQLNKRLSLAVNWVYFTGNAITFPTGKYTLGEEVYYYYSERNGFRMPAYHRMDFGLNYYKVVNERFEHGFNFSIYNLYSRQNPFFLGTVTEGTDQQAKTKVMQYSLFPFIPSITYNFKILAKKKTA